MVAILLLSLYVAQQGEDVSTILNEAVRRFDAYRERGQLPAEKDQLIQFLVSQETHFGRNADFLRAQSRYLASLGELAASQTVFAKIPDEALTDPDELVVRLDDRYRADPELAIPVALRLASLDDADARDLFVRWIHGSLALDFAPRLEPGSQTLAHDRFLGALSKPRDSFAAHVSSALRMWIDAQRTSDPSRLAALMDLEFTEPLSLGPRYQLLLYDLIERKVRSEALVLAARRRRHELTNVLLPLIIQGAYGPGRERQRLRYWCAYGRNVESELALRAGARVVPTLQDAADCSTDRGAGPTDVIWIEEMNALGGRREYVSPLADFIKTLGRFDLELYFRTDAARTDSSALAALADAYSRVDPGESFDSYWQRERFTFALKLPALAGDDANGTRAVVSSGRWLLVKMWSTSCLPCVQQLSVLESLARQFAGAVLLVDVEDSPTALKAYKTAHGVTLPFAKFAANGELRLPPLAAPATLIIAPDGRALILDEADWQSEARYWLSFGNPVR